MNWTGLIPLKATSDRKSRLSVCLSLDERIRLSEEFALHVATVISASTYFGSVIFVGEAPLSNHAFDCVKCKGDDLNQELLRTVDYLDRDRVAVVFADLPLLSTNDVDCLVEGALACGSSIAPDRYGIGTNALALVCPVAFRFHFGERSFQAHRALLPKARIVRRAGLEFDVDTPADFRGVIGQFRSGRSALERMLSGSLDDLSAVRRYVESQITNT